MKEIGTELSQLLKSAEKTQDNWKMNQDKTGKSTVSGIFFEFKDGGNASVQCYDYSEVMKPRIDNLRLAIRTKEYRKWYFESLK